MTAPSVHPISVQGGDAALRRPRTAAEVRLPKRAVPTTIRHAFSLIEILVTVTLLSVIILGLVAMFNQTQRAFTSSFNQGDILEGGRTACEMIARELEQMSPCYGASNVQNFYVTVEAGMDPSLTTLQLGGGDSMTNTMQQLYFMVRDSQQWYQWNGFGYEVDPSAVTLGVGTLYRYNTNFGNQLPAGQGPLFTSLLPSQNANNFNPVIDGVVDFRIRVYDKSGNPINGSFPTNVFPALYTGRRNAATGDFTYAFYGSAVPAYVEVELGVLETRTLEHWRALTNSSTLAAQYLTSHAGQVHVFRERVTIRAMDPVAYPYQ